jgi:hypothetical protein
VHISKSCSRDGLFSFFKETKTTRKRDVWQAIGLGFLTLMKKTVYVYGQSLGPRWRAELFSPVLMLQRCTPAQVPTMTKLGQWFKNNMAALLNGLPKLPRYCDVSFFCCVLNSPLAL